jgi:hypothetical protein
MKLITSTLFVRDSLTMQISFFEGLKGQSHEINILFVCIFGAGAKIITLGSLKRLEKNSESVRNIMEASENFYLTFLTTKHQKS